MPERVSPTKFVQRHGLPMLVGILLCGVAGSFIGGADGRTLGGGIGAALGIVVGSVISRLSDAKKGTTGSGGESGSAQPR